MLATDLQTDLQREIETETEVLHELRSMSDRVIKGLESGTKPYDLIAKALLRADNDQYEKIATLVTQQIISKTLM